jgi:plastocyanin
MTGRTRILILSVAAAAVTTALACGGYNPGGPSGTGGGGGSTGGPGPSGATITIGANGAISPSSVTISSGQSVTFVNNHTVNHVIDSDPHPAHTDCPAINNVDLLAPGQTRLTNALTAIRTCGFHDHNDPTNANLQGTIVVR